MMKKGMIYAALSYIIWGLLPIYWKQIEALSSIYILAVRIALSMILCIALFIVFNKWENVKAAVKNKKSLAFSMTAGVIMSLNWFTYIWAVNSGHILDASLGYYINPLMAALCGALLFKEKIGKWEKISILLAAVGVAVMVIGYGKIPWVALILALTFMGYGVFKKLAGIDTFTALLIETATVFPIAAGYIIFAETGGRGVMTTLDLTGLLWLSMAGVVTAVPTFFYGAAISAVPLTTVGFFQYISPTINLLIGVLIYNEEFSSGQIIAFIFIWVALIIYVLSKIDLLGGIKKEAPVPKK